MKIFKTIKLADYVTLANFVCGFLSIIFAVQNQFRLSAVLILLAVLFDFLDGRVARMTKTNNEFGKQLDSLCDAVSFGVAPALLAYSLGLDDLKALVVLTFFASCGILRLARFNTLKIKGFMGVPITTNGLVFPILYLALSFFGYAFNDYYLILYLVMGFLMISDLRIKKM